MQQLAGAPAVGDRLPNGATVLDAVISQRDAHSEGTYYYGYVLAQSGTEIVSWRLGIDPKGEIHTWSGRYFKSIYKAVQNYSERVAGT
jgi:hypothetical protein